MALNVFTDEERYYIVDNTGKKYYIDSLGVPTAISFLKSCLKANETHDGETIQNFLSQFGTRNLTTQDLFRIFRITDIDGIDYAEVKKVFEPIDKDAFRRVSDEFYNQDKYSSRSEFISKMGLAPSMGRRNSSSPHNWESLDMDTYKITKPTVICLSGNEATTPILANGFCKIAENMLGIGNVEDQENVDIVGLSYRDKSGNNGAFSREDRTKIVKNLFVPLFFDGNGQKLSKEQANKNMSLVTFFSWCHGNDEIAKIFSELEKILVEDYDLDITDVREIISSTRNVCYAPQNSLNMFVPTVYANSEKDYTLLTAVGEESNMPESLKLNLNKVGELDGQDCKYHTQETIEIRSAELMNSPELNEFRDEHTIWTIEREKDWTLRPFQNADGRKYYSGKNGDCVSQMMAYALSRSVAGSIENYNSDRYVPRISMQGLLTELKDIKSAFSTEDLSPRE